MTATHGLVIGKFYPPHAGHHHLVRVAAAQSARLTDEALRAECERLMQDEEAVAGEMAELREWEEISAPWPD
jgi:hypothetical protein